MTREQAKELAPIIKAYGDGAEIELRRRCHRDNWDKLLSDANFESGDINWRIKPTPKKRPMTRGEVLYLVTTTPGMVVSRTTESAETILPDNTWLQEIGTVCYPFHYAIQAYCYAIIDRHGNPIDGWKKFEIEEDNE